MSTADACADTASTGTNHINWSITTSAPTTSQVIGVLAALVFAAIILLLQVGSASTAAVGTFLSICWLFAAHRIGSEQLFLAKAITVIVVVAAWTHTTLTLFYVVLAVERPQRGDPSTGVQWWGIALATVPVVVAVVASCPSPVRRWLDRNQDGLFGVTSAISLVAAVVLLAGFSSMPLANPQPETFPIELRFIIMGILSLVFALYLANMALIRRVPPSNTATTSSRLQPPAPKLGSVPDDNDRRRLLRISIEFRNRRRSIR